MQSSTISLSLAFSNITPSSTTDSARVPTTIYEFDFRSIFLSSKLNAINVELERDQGTKTQVRAEQQSVNGNDNYHVATQENKRTSLSE